MSWLEYILIGILLLWIVISILWMRNRRKKGRCIGCGGDCSQCIYHQNQK